ncbi:hypothetical protein BM1_09242 [Bipolaris maydis]|nr:hypothetical protein BM1_09242 [Bipolaris maydis]
MRHYFDKRRAVAPEIVISGLRLKKFIANIPFRRRDQWVINLWTYHLLILADKLGLLNMFAFADISTEIVFRLGDDISAETAAISICTKNRRITGMYMSMGTSTTGFAISFGLPVNGAQVDKYRGFEQVLISSGTISLSDGILTLSSRLVTRRGILDEV